MHTCLVRLSNISHYEIVSSYLQLCQSLIICTEIFHTEHLHKAEFGFFLWRQTTQSFLRSRLRENMVIFL